MHVLVWLDCNKRCASRHISEIGADPWTKFHNHRRRFSEQPCLETRVLTVHIAFAGSQEPCIEATAYLGYRSWLGSNLVGETAEHATHGLRCVGHGQIYAPEISAVSRQTARHRPSMPDLSRTPHHSHRTAAHCGRCGCQL